VSTPGAPAITAILLDVEGTTTPLAFVKDVLFPYARTHLRSHLETHAGAAEYELLVTRLHEEYALALRAGETVPPWTDDSRSSPVSGVIGYLEWLMDRDRKSTPLKELQGWIWEEGYRRGELIGQVFPDVRPALERWYQQKLPVGIFSSGSVLAQQLLFRHSSDGDLTTCVRWYFDTRVGPKTESDSYRRIAQSMGVPVENVLFLSDVTNELDAARSAGMRVRLAVRPGNAAVRADHGYPEIRSLEEVNDGR
jgi:enolase-phosphatase E1